MTQEIILIVLLCLATHRVTHLIVTDQVPFGPIRDTIQGWFENRWIDKHGKDDDINSEVWLSKGAYFLTCPWCVSMWVSAVLLVPTWWVYDLHYPWLVWLAASSVTGLLSSRE